MATLMDRLSSRNHSARPQYAPAGDENLPEALPQQEVTHNEKYVYDPAPTRIHDGLEVHEERDFGAVPDKRIFGLNRRLFWILAGSAIILVVIAAVVRGVVGSQSSNQSSDNSEDDSNSNSSNSTTSNIPHVPGMHPKSRLAAYNFTLDGVTNRRVYFQNESGVIMESSWSSNQTEWTVAPVTIPSNVVFSTDTSTHAETSDLEVKIGTPLAVSVSLSDFFQLNVFYLDPQNGLKLVKRLEPLGDWELSGDMTGTTTHSESDLAAYWLPTCDSPCTYHTIIVFQAPDRTICSLDRENWQRKRPLPMGKVDAGASFVMGPTPPRISPRDAGVRIFINDGGRPRSCSFNPSSSNGWYLEDMQSAALAMPPSASIAAFLTNVGDGSFTNWWCLLHTSSPSDDNGGIDLATGINQGSAPVTWTPRWGSLPEGADVVSGSPISADVSGAIFAIKDDKGSKTLGWWSGSPGGVVNWTGSVTTE